jgi:hypothetical protein
MCESPNNEIEATPEEVLAKLEELCEPDENTIISCSLLRSKFPTQKKVPSSSIYGAITALRKKFEANQTKLDQINQKIKILAEEVEKEIEEELKSKLPTQPARDTRPRGGEGPTDIF